MGLLAACNNGDNQAPPGELPQTFRAIAIDAGDTHTCALIEDGTVKCWGANRIGQLVGNIGTDAPTPVTINGINNATALAVGGAHACALLADQTVKCWGAGINWMYGVAADDPSVAAVPVVVPGLSGVTALSAGGAHTCALLADGMVKCWGEYINDGSIVPLIGADPAPPIILELPAPTLMSGVSGAITLVSGISHTCAILADRTVKCWGVNQSGQLGNGGYVGSATPVPVSGLTNVATLAAGERQTCAVLMDRTVKCWGYDGSVYDYYLRGSSTPVTLSDISGVITVTIGGWHACATLEDQTVKCWGSSNSYGELGEGVALNGHSFMPVAIKNIAGVTALSAGKWHTCALTGDQNIRCWGYNQYGQLGNGSLGYASTAVPVVGLADARAVTAGSAHSCVLLGNGAVTCWGHGQAGQLGNGAGVDSVLPVLVSDINNATALASGSTHTCALLADRTVKCWGFNGYSGPDLPWPEPPRIFLKALTPVTVSGLTDVVALAATWEDVCAVIADGTVKCWKVGAEPVLVDGLASVSMVTMGWDGHRCALLADRTVKCWGSNLGWFSDTPVIVNGLTDVIVLEAGAGHTCAVLADRTAKCWGDNWYGQLGDGTGFNSLTPVTVSDINSAVALASGWQSSQSCAVLADQTLKCWGWVNDGQIYDGTSPYDPYYSFHGRALPETIPGLTGVTAVASGSLHTCAVLADYTVKCWGYNGYGQLGNGMTGYSAMPVRVIGS